MENLENFIKTWNSQQALKRGNKAIMVCPDEFDGVIYSFDIRFAHRDIDSDNFEYLKNRIFITSKNLLQVTSTVNEYKSGILRVAVLLCNHGYSDKIVQAGLDIILNDLLPNLRG